MRSSAGRADADGPLAPVRRGSVGTLAARVERHNEEVTVADEQSADRFGEIAAGVGSLVLTSSTASSGSASSDCASRSAVSANRLAEKDIDADKQKSSKNLLELRVVLKMRLDSKCFLIGVLYKVNIQAS